MIMVRILVRCQGVSAKVDLLVHYQTDGKVLYSAEGNGEFSYPSAKKYMQVSKSQKGNALSFSSLRQALGYDGVTGIEINRPVIRS